jgi:hypothetical protein
MYTVVAGGEDNRDAASTSGHISIADLPAMRHVRRIRKVYCTTPTYCKSCGENMASLLP